MSDVPVDQQVAVAEAIRLIEADKWTAHSLLFRHRHQLNGRIVPSADFHEQFVNDFWSDEQYRIDLAFRGSAKSTTAEESITLAVALRAYRNILIIGSSEARAAERLASVAYELSQNEPRIRLFGDQKSRDRPGPRPSWSPPTGAASRRWAATRISAASNTWISARILSSRTISRTRTTSRRRRAGRKTLRWFLAELLPACAPHWKVRILATPMNAESVPMQADPGGRLEASHDPD